MTRPADPARRPGDGPVAAAPQRGRVQRFTRGEHWAHRSNAILFGICIASALCLYVGPIAVLVGRRGLFKNIHVMSGVMLPIPLLAAWFLSPGFQSDARRLGRFSPRDWEWLRRRDRRRCDIPLGKFNPGQKLNAAFILGAVLVSLGTGLIMRFFQPFPDSWRTGATFVHDWLALMLFVVIIGHIYMALKDPESLVGMRTGTVSWGYARRNHSGWAAEMGVPPPAGSRDDGLTELRYTATVTREDDRFVARCSAGGGADVSSEGATEQEALANLRQVLELA